MGQTENFIGGLVAGEKALAELVLSGGQNMALGSAFVEPSYQPIHKALETINRKGGFD